MPFYDHRKACYISDLARDVAGVIGCSTEELEGQNIFKVLDDLPPETIVYLPFIREQVNENDTF